MYSTQSAPSPKHTSRLNNAFLWATENHRPIVSLRNSSRKSMNAICHICSRPWCRSCQEYHCHPHTTRLSFPLKSITKSPQQAIPTCTSHTNSERHLLRTCFSFGGHSTWFVAFTTAISSSCNSRPIQGVSKPFFKVQVSLHVPPLSITTSELPSNHWWSTPIRNTLYQTNSLLSKIHTALKGGHQN